MQMKRWIVIAGAVLVVVLLVLVALPFLIDVNRFRPELESKASAALGRKVTLGKLDLSLFSGNVVARDIAIADDPAFSSAAFLSAKSVRIGVEMKPLIFERKLNVTSITINEPQITLLQRTDGTWNFSSLDRSGDSNAPHTGAPQPPVFVHELLVKDGTLTVGKLPSAQVPQVFDHFNVEAADVSPTSRFGFRVVTGLPGGGRAALSGKVGPIDGADAARTTFEAVLKANDVHLDAYGADPALGIDGLASLDEAVVSYGSVLKATGVLSGEHLKFFPRSAPLPKAVSITHSLEVGMGKDTGAVAIKNADIAIGRAHLLAAGNLQTVGTGATVDLKVHGSKMPLDDLQPLLTVLKVDLPKHAHFRGGTLSVDATVTGTKDAPIIAGNVQLDHTTMVGFNLGASLGSMAAFTGKAASKPDTTFIQLTAKFIATNAGTKVSMLRSDIEGIGVSSGSGTVDAKGNQNFMLIANPTGGVAGSLTKMSANGREKGKGWVPVAMTGTSVDPIFTADSKTAAHNALAQTSKGVSTAISNLFHKEKKDDKAKKDDKGNKSKKDKKK
jgi:AsmA protein